MRAYLSRQRSQRAAVLMVVAVLAWGLRHLFGVAHAGSVGNYLYQHWVFLFSFCMLAFVLVTAYLEKPVQQAGEDMYDVTVVVPAYNEDPAVLKECLSSIITQSRTPDAVYVTDDGSRVDYAAMRQWFEECAATHGIVAYWHRQPNAGKRHAQAAAFERVHTTDIFVTVDSDSILDYVAIEELLKPFADSAVQSVAGVVLAKNNRTNLLARFTDLLFVTGQLLDRSMMSRLGSVLVNSGGLAAYRAPVVLDNLQAYLHEDYFGSRIEFSDDSMLTLYALARGKTVQQPTAFVFTMMPDRLSHHLRQQVRWMKGSFIRSWWRLRYLPAHSAGFMRQAIGWAQFTMTTTLLVSLLIVRPNLHVHLVPYLVLVPVALGYVQGLRYFSVKRSDESFASQLLTYALTPLAILWAYFVLRPIRLYASLTCLRGGWGTRQAVEITLERKQKLRRFAAMTGIRLVRETRYESVQRMIAAYALTPDEAEVLWRAYYRALPTERKYALWSEYDRVLQRIEAAHAGKRYVIARHRKQRHAHELAACLPPAVFAHAL